MIYPIIGATGSGKTEIARRLVIRAMAQKQHQIVLIDDPNSQWTAEKLARSGMPYFEPTTVRSIEQLKRGRHQNRWIRLTGLLPDDVYEAVEYARQFHQGRDREIHKPDVALVFDEIFRLCSPKRGWIGGERGAFWDVMLSHRHLGLCIYGCAQSPSIVDRRLLDNAEQTFICRLQGQRDMAWIADTYGDEYAEAVRGLPPKWPLQTVIRIPGEPPRVEWIADL